MKKTDDQNTSEEKCPRSPHLPVSDEHEQVHSTPKVAAKCVESKDPEGDRSTEPLECKRAPAVPSASYILPALKGSCYERFSVGTVIKVRHGEYSFDRKAPDKMYSDKSLTHSFAYTPTGIICTTWRPAVVVHSFDDVIQYIPLRTNDGNGIRYIDSKHRVKYLRVDVKGEKLGRKTNDSPHQPIKFEPTKHGLNWKPNSYLQATEICTLTPVVGTLILGRLCEGEKARIDALCSALVNHTMPPPEAKLDRNSLQNYFNSNPGGAEIDDTKYLRSNTLSSNEPPHGMGDNKEQHAESPDQYLSRARSSSKDRTRSDRRYNDGRSRSRSPFRHEKSRKESDYRDRSRGRFRNPAPVRGRREGPRAPYQRDSFARR